MSRVAALDPQRARALRAVELVGRQREEINAERADVDGNLPDRLHGVGVEQGAVLVRERREVRDRLNRADFVVGVHDRDDGGICRSGAPEPLRTDDAGRVDRQEVVSIRGGEALSVLSTASCSMALAIRWRRPWARGPRRRREAPRLSASVPPLVNTISEGSACSRRPMSVLASSRRALARCPK